ncbi:MAG: 16S rRNA (cytosine(1402)-N(4))-methyltransferase RsmH [Lachnospiraceae bacterium]|nr:16S rRNA (cytosine(1402)-N(4))-methyltransferase RsmH [Lachnospiraceae bacterium]
MGAFIHKSVLLDECIASLCLKPDGTYVDGTTGGGGHSFEIARHLTSGRLCCFDQDADAMKAAGERLAEYGDKVTFFHRNFVEMKDALHGIGIEKVNGILLDLGVSSYQIDEEERGFSYMKEDAPLDMRMDRRSDLTAAKIVNTYSEKELADILHIYGEERFAKTIAKNIIKAREQKEIRTAGELVRIIETSIPAKARRTGGHPGKRTFQALRIEANDELGVLKASLSDMIDLLEEGGRLAVITFHSLEDRIVKQAFAAAQKPCVCPKEFPVCVCGKKPSGYVVTRKPILPGEAEMEANSRAKSAKLRVFEKRSRME